MYHKGAKLSEISRRKASTMIPLVCVNIFKKHSQPKLTENREEWCWEMGKWVKGVNSMVMESN